MKRGLILALLVAAAAALRPVLRRIELREAGLDCSCSCAVMADLDDADLDDADMDPFEAEFGAQP